MAVSSILEKALYSTLRIETTLGSGEQGAATAFIFEYRTADNNYPFMVTTKTPVITATEGRITLLQAKDGQPLAGKGYTLDIEHFKKLWYCHPDDQLDIAVTPFVPFVKHVEKAGTPVFFHALIQDIEETRKAYEQIQLADEIISVGFDNDFWDRKTLSPVVRQGTVASLAKSDYMGKPRFLANIHVAKGAEGGPVFQRNKLADEGKQTPFLAGMLVPAPIASNQNDQSKTVREMGTVIRIEAVIDTISAYLREKGFI